MSIFDKGVLDDFLDGFGDKKSEPAKTTDEPDFKLFMLQVMNRFQRLITKDAPMDWCKTFRNKDTGVEYTVTIKLEQTRTP